MNFISCVAENYASWSKASPYRFSWARLGHHRPGTRLLIITREQTVAHLPRFRFGPAPGSGELLWRFCRLPLVELKFSNNDVAAVRRSAVTESVAFRWLASLVVVRRHRARLDVVSGSLGTEPVRRSASGSVDTTTPCHSCTFPFFATNSYSMWSPTLIWSTEGSMTAVLLMATMLDTKISSFVLSYRFELLPSHRTSTVGNISSTITVSCTTRVVPELYIEHKLTFTYIPASVFRSRVYGFSGVH